MQQNQYDYEEDGTYCYPGTDVLKNKLNIHDKEILSDAERSISLVRMIELEEHPIRGNYDLDHLKRIHKALFGDIFEWAGQLRTVDISKGTMFCKCEYIESNANKLFRELKDENNLIGLRWRIWHLDWHTTFVRSMRYIRSEKEMGAPRGCL